MQLTCLGTAGWEITNGETVILVDPYFTRAKYNSPNDAVAPDDPRPLVTVSSFLDPDAGVIDAHVRNADFVLITHGHPDHAFDMPYIARKTGAIVIGTASTGNLARATGVAADHVKTVSGGDQIDASQGIAGASRRAAPIVPLRSQAGVVENQGHRAGIFQACVV